MDILKNINWVDIVCLVLLLRIVYVASQTGFVTECLKLLATCASLFVAFHYYTELSALLARNFSVPEAVRAVCFIGLWIITYFVCKLIRDGLFMLFAVQADNLLDKWGAAVLAIVRVALTASLLMYLALISGHKYLQGALLKSVSHSYVLRIAPAVYTAACDNFVTKLLPNEKKNPAVLQALREASIKK